MIGDIKRFEKLRLRITEALYKAKPTQQTRGFRNPEVYFPRSPFCEELAEFLGLAGELRAAISQPLDCSLCMDRKSEHNSESCKDCILNTSSFPEKKNNFRPALQEERI